MRLTDHNILITGGAGFIGSHLVDACLAQGAMVTVLDDFSTGLRSNLTPHPRLTIITGSLSEFDQCYEATSGKSLIFHLAAHTSVPDSVQNPLTCYTANIQGTYNLLEGARRNRVPHVVFSSSAAVYGAHEGTCHEIHTPCKPLSPYGTSKHMGEILCKEYGTLYGIRSACLRYFNVYGPRQRADLPHTSFVARVRHAMRHNEPIILYGDGSQNRNFVPVEQIIQANLLISQHLITNTWYGETFNIASPHSETLLQFIKKTHREFPNYNLSLIQCAPPRPGDILHSRAHCDKFSQLATY